MCVCGYKVQWFSFISILSHRPGMGGEESTFDCFIKRLLSLSHLKQISDERMKCLVVAQRDPVLPPHTFLFFLFHPKFAYQAAAALNSQRHNYGRRCGRGCLMGSWPQTPVGTFSDFNLEPFEKLCRATLRSPGGSPLTLTKDIMVNGKVLHFRIISPSQDFCSRCPGCLD